MPREGITEQEVFDAAESLMADNEKVNAKNIRDWLGTGSLSTITKHLRTWNAKGSVPALDIEDIDTYKPALLEALAPLIEELRRQGLQRADRLTKEHGAERQQYEECLAALGIERDDLATKLDQATEVNKTLQAELDALSQQAKELNTGLQASKETRIGLESDLAAAQAAFKTSEEQAIRDRAALERLRQDMAARHEEQAANHQTQLQEKQREITALQAKAQTQESDFRAAEKTWQSERDDFIDERDTLRQEKAVLVVKQEGLNTSLVQQREESLRIQEQYEATLDELRQAENQRSDTEILWQSLKGDHKILEASVTSLERELLTLRDAYQTAQQALIMNQQLPKKNTGSPD